MTQPPDRPDPDALLRRLKEEETRTLQGKLRIFFGFAPGVGKTYRMLQVARDLVIDQKGEVLVGVVETHRRSETQSMLLGLDILPRCKLEYRGRELEEFDLDAALARKPKILLLDELAHTNAPGARHPKRWQDALELLDAGIDVFTTVNVQHVESLNDVVAQITHVRVRETVPDAILDRADEIELVDIAPEELLMRLKEGKVYLPDQALRAAEHFFQRGNLLALRELALRRTAQHVDADVLEYREEHGLVTAWPAGERIVVCVGSSPTSARLIRATFRIAAGLRAPWVAAYVESTVPGRASEADRERLDAHLRLAESLGGTVTRLTGPRVADAVLDYARKHNVTRIVVGKPTHSRLRDRVRGSLVDEIVRGSGDIDVHVISGDGERDAEPQRAARDEPQPQARAAAYAWAAALVAIISALAAAIRLAVPLPDVEMLYLLAIMIAAASFGRGPSILAAALSVAAYDFVFVPPYLTFAVADTQHFLTFAMMFAVGLLISELTARIRGQQRDAVLREERTAALYALSRNLGAADDPRAAGTAVARHVAEAFGGSAFVLQPGDDGVLRQVSAHPADAVLAANEVGVAKWAYEHAQPSGFGTDTLPGAKSICAPLRVGASVVGVLVLQPQSSEPLSQQQRELLDACCRQAAFAFERARLSNDARAATLRAKTEEMRASLLGAVSHDLRTPLATIKGAASSLIDSPGLADGTKSELLEAICEEADRLERLVANLLDMTRLETGAVVLKRDWIPLDEIVGSALTRLDSKLGERRVDVDLQGSLPLISVDPVLFEQLFVNLLENAAKYTPTSSPIELSARLEDNGIAIEVRDRGPGLQPGSEQAVFEKFFRGTHAGVPGVGLGLPICRAIAEAHGGSIRAENRSGGGALFRVSLPLRSAGAGASGGARCRAMSDAGALVLVVEDEPQMRRFLRATLSAHGYRLLEAATAAEAQLLASSHNPALVLLDLGLPDAEGFDVTRTLREWSQVPIIVISARGREDDKIEALDAGADDYLTKPFGVGELLARMRVALRHAESRAGAPEPKVLEFGALRIDFTRREVTSSGQAVHLTPTEYKLLALLAHNAGRVLTHRQILEHVWGPNHAQHTHYVRVHMAELRRKVEANPTRPKLLRTEPGVGYRLSDRDA